jgi:anthranilate/para-aminobenzoate synthase component I
LAEPVALPNKHVRAMPRSDVERAPYEGGVRRVIDYILAGDIYQANISQRFSATLPAGTDPFALYCALRRRNPAPFAAFIRHGDIAIVSASPERFLKLRGGHVETRPIKGTRPRGKTLAEDRALAEELTTSEKDRAENLMIVDLLRNDLSRVCRDRTVEVPVLFGLESYATVHHLVSIVTGELMPGKSAIDLLRAAFPGLHHRRPEDPGHGNHRRTRADAARSLLRQHRLYRLRRRDGYEHRHSDHGRSRTATHLPGRRRNRG